MNQTNESAKQHFNEEKILESEPKFIDIYTKNAQKIRPMKILLGFFRGHYFRLFCAAFFYMLKTTPTWVTPLITADIINVAVSRPENAVRHIVTDLIIAAVLIAQNIPTHLLYIRLFSQSSRSVEAGLRGAMIRKLQQLSISFHKEMESGKIQSKVMRDVESVAEFSRSIFDTGLNVLINMTVTLIVVILHNRIVFYFFLVAVPLGVLIRRAFSKKMRSQSHDFRKEIEHTASAVYEMEELVPVTRAHALEHKEVRKLTRDVIGVAESGYRFDFLQNAFASCSWVTFTILQVGCLCFTAFLALRGKITVGEISLYQSYFGTLVAYVSSLIGLMPVIAKGSESIRSIGEILSAYDVENNHEKETVPPPEGAFEFRDVCFNYDEQTPVLRNFNLSVRAGETVALVGESGSGKSTVMNLVIGFNRPQSGLVTVDGRDITGMNLHEYRKWLSVVPQNSILFSGTVRDNITYGSPNVSEEQLMNAVHAAQLDSVIEKLPNGLETMVGEHGDKLSGGQRQRISIARAIIRDPRIIIFDEATSALDSVTEREIQKAIDNLTADRTTFIVAHRLSTIRNADKIAVLREGRCVEFGTYDELLAKKGEFYNYKMMQS